MSRKSSEQDSMIQQIDETRTQRLNELHSRIMDGIRTTVELAIEAGGILAEVKGSLPHGQFTQWVEDNTAFDVRTAQRYMKAYRNRDRLKNDTVSSLRQLTEEPKAATAGTAYLISPKGKLAIVSGLRSQGRPVAWMCIANHKQPGYVVREWYELDDGDGVTAVFDTRGIAASGAFMCFDTFDAQNVQKHVLDGEAIAEVFAGKPFVYAPIEKTDLAVVAAK